MTVDEVIEFLAKIKDKETMMMVDCPHCGKGHQINKIFEAVILTHKKIGLI